MKRFIEGFVGFLGLYVFVAMLWSAVCWCFGWEFSAQEAFGVYILAFILNVVR